MPPCYCSLVLWCDILWYWMIHDMIWYDVIWHEPAFVQEPSWLPTLKRQGHTVGMADLQAWHYEHNTQNKPRTYSNMLCSSTVCTQDLTPSLEPQTATARPGDMFTTLFNPGHVHTLLPLTAAWHKPRPLGQSSPQPSSWALADRWFYIWVIIRSRL